MKRLNLVTDLNAAHTLDAAAGVTNKRKIAVGLVALNARFIFVSEDIKVIRNLLKLACSAADAGCAIAVVLAENELNVNGSCLADTRTVCENDHVILSLCVAGGNKALVAFNFNNANSAGADFVKLFKIAEGGNIDMDFSCRVKDCCAVFNLNGYVIYCELYHLNILPPFSAP